MRSAETVVSRSAEQTRAAGERLGTSVARHLAESVDVAALGGIALIVIG